MTSARTRSDTAAAPTVAPRRRRGRSGKSAAEIESQRWQLIGAAAEMLADGGYAHITSRAIARRAGVSPEVFYVHFENLDACLLAAGEQAADCLWELVAAACTGAGEWPQRLRGAVESAIEYIVTEPALARLLGPEAAAGVAAIASVRQGLIERLAGLLCAGRQLRIETADALPHGLELHLVSGAFALVSECVALGHPDRLPGMAPSLTEILILPFREPGSSVVPL